MEQAISWDPCCSQLPFPSPQHVHTHALFFACPWKLYPSLPSHSTFFKNLCDAIPHEVSADCCRVGSAYNPLALTLTGSAGDILPQAPSTLYEAFLLLLYKVGCIFYTFHLSQRQKGVEWGNFACAVCFCFSWFFKFYFIMEHCWFTLLY